MRIYTILMLLVSRIKIGSRNIRIGPYLIQWGSTTFQTEYLNAEYYFWTGTQAFPIAFSETPLVWLQDDLGGDYLSTNSASTISTTEMTIKHKDTRLTTTNIRVHWLAIGVA